MYAIGLSALRVRHIAFFAALSISGGGEQSSVPEIGDKKSVQRLPLVLQIQDVRCTASGF